MVDGLPRNAAYLEELLRSLKRSLGTGGTVREGALELQGDRRDALRTLLAARGFAVKG
jgi:translation initiation factor 1